MKHITGPVLRNFLQSRASGCDDRSMGRIRTLLFFEVDLSIAAAKFPEGYLTSLGFGLGELCSGVRRRRWRGMSVP